MITVRFYEELNDFLKNREKKTDLTCPFTGKRSVKDLIESFGIPHTEVDLILINGESAGFEEAVTDGDRISVYPVFERLDIGKVTRLRPEPLRESRFVLDVHLGKLAGNLRLLGFDADYSNFRDDEDLAGISLREHRILLTRDRGLLMRKSIRWGMLIRNTAPMEQTAEVLNRLDLWEKTAPFSRCLSCGGILETLPSEQFESLIGDKKIPTGVSSWCKEYRRCASCKKIFWQGGHYASLSRRIEKITEMKR